MAMYFARQDALLTIHEALTYDNDRPTAARALTAEGVPFQHIGLNLPLTIELRSIWTGKHPEGGIFSPDHSMLVTSAMKGFLMTSAAPRAINFLTGKLEKHSLLSVPGSTEPGTPLVCYSPAVTEGAYSLQIEVGFNSFNDDLVKGVGNAFQQAASFPLFLPAAPYLLAASSLTKLADDIGHMLFNTGIVLSHTEPLHIFHPGSEPLVAGYALILPDGDAGNGLRSQLQITSDGKVVTASGAAYTGDVPYVVISFDGTPQDAYRNFVPLAATADQLATFFNLGDNASKLIGDVVDGLKLLNDLKYRNQADSVSKRLNNLSSTDPQYKTLSDQYKALVANIQSDFLKPAEPKPTERERA
jgi:hypothetical protein